MPLLNKLKEKNNSESGCGSVEFLHTKPNKLQLNVDSEQQRIIDCWEHNATKIQMHIDLCLNAQSTWFNAFEHKIQQGLHTNCIHYKTHLQLTRDIYKAIESMSSLPQQKILNQFIDIYLQKEILQ